MCCILFLYNYNVIFSVCYPDQTRFLTANEVAISYCGHARGVASAKTRAAPRAGKITDGRGQKLRGRSPTRFEPSFCNCVC